MGKYNAIISEKKKNKFNSRSLSAKKNNSKIKNNLYDINCFSSHNEFELLEYQKRMPTPISSKFSLMKNNNNYNNNIQNNRYNISTQMNNLITNKIKKKK